MKTLGICRHAGDACNKQEQKIGKNGKVTLEMKERAADLKIKLNDGDIEPGMYDVSFSCPRLGTTTVFAEALVVKQNGHAEFDATIPLEEESRYNYFQVLFQTILITFTSFSAHYKRL